MTPVRIACWSCDRRGQYRLARLVDRFGPDLRLTDVLHEISADCPRRDLKTPGNTFCGAHFADLGSC